MPTTPGTCCSGWDCPSILPCGAFTATARPPLEDLVTEHSKAQGRTRGKPGAASGGHTSRLDSQPLGFISVCRWRESRHFRRSVVLMRCSPSLEVRGCSAQAPSSGALRGKSLLTASGRWGAVGGLTWPGHGQVRVLGQEGSGLAVRHQSVCSGLRQLSRRCRRCWAVRQRAHVLTHAHTHTNP